MYTFERTEDVATIKAVMAHPCVYPTLLVDDYGPTREEWEPLLGNPLVQYFAIRKDWMLVGMFMCNLHSAVEVEIHSAFLPIAWGRYARPAALSFREWIWANKPTVQRIIGKVLASNIASIHYAEAIGFKRFGVDEKSFMRGGGLQDQIYFGMSRPEVVQSGQAEAA